MKSKIDIMKETAKKLKSKLQKQKANYCENWGQKEIQQLRELFDYENYAQSNSIVNDFENWIENQ